MNINTIGELKKAIEEFQAEYNIPDDTPVRIPVQSYTQAYPADYFRMTMIGRAAGALCLYVNMPEGFSISKRKTA